MHQKLIPDPFLILINNPKQYVPLCTRMPSACHSHILVCHPYVTRMYLYVICMSIVCTRMSSVCHSYVLVRHPYVTRMNSFVIRMSLVCGFTMKYNYDSRSVWRLATLFIEKYWLTLLFIIVVHIYGMI